MIGQRIGNYKISELLGEGGMGSVYLAEHPGIGRRVAVKIVHGEMLEQDPTLATRFFNEARAANAVGHPGIVAVLDHGTLPTGAPYLVMEYLGGESLSTRIRRRAPFPPAEAIDIVLQAASALAAAHVKGIIHRDLKPDNLILVPDPQVPGREQVKVLDFGIAKFGKIGGSKIGSGGGRSYTGDGRSHTGDGRSYVGDGASNTFVGALLGTPAYMSPEQCLGKRDVDHRSDIYSLGIILYELLCGTPPFVSDKQGELIYFHIGSPPIAPRRRNPSIPEALEALVLKMLAKDPAERIQTMVDLQRALTGELPGASAEPPTRPKRNSRPVTTLAASALPLGARPPAETKTGRWIVALLAGTLAAAGALGLSLWKRQRPRPQPATATTAAIVPAQTPTVMPLPAPPPEAPAPVQVNVATQPAGARLVRENDGEVLGTTPFSAAWPATDGEERLRLELRGYQTETIVVPRQIGAELELALKPLAIAAAPRRRKPPPPPPRAAAAKRKPRPSTPARHEPVPL